MSLGAEERLARDEAMARAIVNADRNKKAAEEREREARQAEKRERLKREMANPSEGDEPAGELKPESKKAHKKKRKASSSTSALSFDAEDDG